MALDVPWLSSRASLGNAHKQTDRWVDGRERTTDRNIDWKTVTDQQPERQRKKREISNTNTDRQMRWRCKQ